MCQRSNKNFDLKLILDNYYQRSVKSNLEFALKGWVYSINFDNNFIRFEHSSINKNYNISKKLLYKKSKILKKRKLLDLNSNIFESINNEKEISKKYFKIQEILADNNKELTQDSFATLPNNNLLYAQSATFDSSNFNVLILGAGITGLFLAHTIKNLLGSKINILILDNRTNKKNFRKTFDRNWLTHIRNFDVIKNTEKKIGSLLSSFGNSEYIGIPINFFEAILKLSCKEQGTKFFYSSELDLKLIENDKIDFIFDATGGRSKLSKSVNKKSINLVIKFYNQIFNNSGSGVVQNRDMIKSLKNELQIELRSTDSRYFYPYFQSYKIENLMLKLTKVPIKLVKYLLDFSKVNNYNNLFYVWPGKLREELNEALIFVNLHIKDYQLYSTILKDQENLNSFYKNKKKQIENSNKQIATLFNFLISLDIKKSIQINKPFIYKPYINFLDKYDYINDRKVYPIGDSIFSGNPKAGNGLAAHIIFINNMIEEIKTKMDNS